MVFPIIRADAESHQGQEQSIRAVRAADGVRRMRELRNFALEPLDRLAENKCLILDDLHHRVQPGG